MWRTLTALCAAALIVTSARADEKKTEQPRVEVVFCLDTTGSMGGLLEGAKQKIWQISNQIASGKPTPALKVGLVAYRDKKDAYVTQVHDLTDDLDAVYQTLKTFQAQGGGDTPEHVNQALDDSVNKIKWSTDKKTLRIIFLVGDAPPHMDYTDDVKYPDTCKKACEKGILINTIQCGSMAETTRIWRDIAVKAEGSFAQIAQQGGVVAAIETPFDKELAEINTKLAKSTLVFGDRARREAGDKKRDDAEKLGGGPGGAAPAAERAGYLAKSGTAAAYDLIDQIKAGKVKLEDLKKDELPEAMQKMTLPEQKEYLAKVAKEREELLAKALELDKKRAEFIAKKAEEDKDKPKAGFDKEVLDTLRKQAEKAGIKY